MFEKIGGRKFVLTVLCLVAAVVIEMRTERGISMAFATLVVGLVASFHAANTMCTVKQPEAEEAQPVEGALTKAHLDEAHESLQNTQAQMQDSMANIGTAVSNLNKILVGALTPRQNNG